MVSSCLVLRGRPLENKALLGGKNCAPGCKILCFFVVVIGSLCMSFVFCCAFFVVVIGSLFFVVFFGGRDL